MTKTATPPRSDGLEQKFKLLALLPYDERAKRKHSLVFGFVLDWYHSKYGDALASVRHVATTIKERDPAGKGMSLPHVHSALTDLVSWGYLEQTLGSGKRASRYTPNWAMLKPSVTPVGNASELDRSVTPGVNADVPPGVNTSSVLVTPVGNEDPSTPIRVHDPETGIDGVECAAPVAPLADGLEAIAARTAQGDGFDRLWKAYSHRQRKADARAAFDKLAPSPELLEQMVLSAGAWFAAWSAQNKPEAPRFSLKNWIEREEYECDPPTAFKPKERAPKVARTEPSPNNVVAMVGEVSPFSSFGTFEAEIYEAGVITLDPFTQRLTLNISLGDGTKTFHKFDIQAADLREQERGRAMLNSITSALEIDGEIEDTDDLLFRPMICTIGKGTEQLFISYSPLAANENHMECAA